MIAVEVQRSPRSALLVRPAEHEKATGLMPADTAAGDRPSSARKLHQKLGELVAMESIQKAAFYPMI